MRRAGFYGQCHNVGDGEAPAEPVFLLFSARQEARPPDFYSVDCLTQRPVVDSHGTQWIGRVEFKRSPVGCVKNIG